jgi:hypothetical protein
MAALIVHVNREVMHRGGEIGVLRDLYRAVQDGSGRRLQSRTWSILCRVTTGEVEGQR